MYHFDRFFLGIGLLLALYGGPLIATQLESASGVWWKRVGVAALLLYGLFNGALVDVMMVHDANLAMVNPEIQVFGRVAP